MPASDSTPLPLTPVAVAAPAGEADRDRCEGNAVCVKIAPEVFQLDDDEYAMVTVDPVAVEQEMLAGQAIAECPRPALSREEYAARSAPRGEEDRRPPPPTAHDVRNITVEALALPGARNDLDRQPSNG